MQAIIFTGIQASGKSSYYQQHFFNTHVRISLDLLNTRNKEDLFLQSCFESQSRFVVDNTNPTVAERNKYIALAKGHKYNVIGYFFRTSLESALLRNNKRTGKAKIPEPGVKSCYKKLEIPSYAEGFDQLFMVTLTEKGFITQNWKDEI